MILLLQLWTAQDLLRLPQPGFDRLVSYGPGPMQFGHLRLPEGPGPHPLAILVHGGCWRSQFDLQHLSSLAAALTRTGVATWNIEYRRVGTGGGWPGTFEDVARAVDFVGQLAGQAPVDPARLVLVGHSAGGHLALWAAGRHRLPATSAIRGANPARVSGVVALAPVPDLAEAGARGICGDTVAQLLGGSREAVPTRYAEASPLALLPLGIPQRLVAAAEDSIVPLALVESYARQSRAAGDDTRLRVLEGIGHFELVGPSTSAWPAIEEAVREVLRVAPQTIARRTSPLPTGLEGPAASAGAGP